MASEDFVADGDLSFMADDATPSGSAVTAASEIDGTTGINAGETVQPTFERAVAGKAIPPGVEPAPAVGQDGGTGVRVASFPTQQT